MGKIYSRIFQKTMHIASYLLNWRQPKLFTSKDDFVLTMAKLHHKRVLLVTDKGLTKLNLYAPLVEAMDQLGITAIVFDETVPNPTISNIEAGLKIYHDNQCTAILAFGGGSSMDCAKGIGARVARPRKSVAKMQGLFKILHRIPDLFAVPTTAGTGSETTVAAVITDDKTHHKYAINDLSLIPRYALLDATITVGLPPHITSTTGMDALCHAVEAYIGKSNTKYTKKCAVEAVVTIYNNLVHVYNNPTDLVAREKMLQASYLAGVAFTRAYVGNVHALSHALSGQYGTPHGLANAIILPIVLRYYGKSAHKPLAKLADAVGITGNTIEEKANKMIDSIAQLNKDLDIPSTIPTIQDADIAHMVDNAYAEAVPLYPVPRILKKSELTELYHIIKG